MTPVKRKARSRADALTTEDACAALGCGRKKLSDLIRKGKVRRAPSFGAAKMWTRDSINALLEGRERVHHRPKPANDEQTTEAELFAALHRARRAVGKH